MSTYRQIFYHIVFSTKHREATLPEEHHEELYKYIWGIVKGHQCKLYRIDGTNDHLHIFSDLHPSVSLADYVKDIKLASSSWMKESGLFPQFTYWQEGYGAFTYSTKERDRVIDYIRRQKEHHQEENFLMNSSACYKNMKSILKKSICFKYWLDVVRGLFDPFGGGVVHQNDYTG